MSHALWTTKEGRRVTAFGRLARPVAIGALFAAGAVAVVKIFGPSTARTLGRAGGEAFAEGVNRAQAQIANLGRGSRWG